MGATRPRGDHPDPLVYPPPSLMGCGIAYVFVDVQLKLELQEFELGE